MDFSPNLPIYIQLMEQIKAQIIAGTLPPGDRVPPVRELALEYTVNPNTMQKALSELEREGILYSERTAGRFVTRDEVYIRALRREKCSLLISQVMKELTAFGLQKEDIIAMIQDYQEEEDL